VERSLTAAALAGLLWAGQAPNAVAETYNFNTTDEQSQSQSAQPEASGKANTREPGLLREGPNTPPGGTTRKGTTFNFDTSDEQTIAQNSAPEGSGKANTREPGAGRAGPTEGLGIKRLSSSQAPASDDFPGRATRTLGRAKEAAEELLPGQPGKALENATRGLRLGKAVSDAGLNLNTTIAAGFDFNTSDEQTLAQNAQAEGSGKANTRDGGRQSRAD
jgi:hypothetical protein